VQESSIYKFSVSMPNPEGLSLLSIVRTPRVYKPSDLATACLNLEIAPSHGEPPDRVVRLCRYLILDFFTMAHRTGLYNRQRNLWEALSKVTAIQVVQHSRGVFRKVVLPLYDVHLQDYKGKTMVLALFVEPEHPLTEKQYASALKRLVKTAERHPGLYGVFFCALEPLPPSFIKMVAGLTGGDDPVAKYESLLPEPNSCSFNLLGISLAQGEAADGEPFSVRLVHPDLTNVKRPRAAAVVE